MRKMKIPVHFWMNELAKFAGWEESVMHKVILISHSASAVAGRGSRNQSQVSA